MNKINYIGRSSEGEKALKKMLDGNHRFVNGLKSVEHTPTPSKLKKLSEDGQKPFCIILSCSDSRVPAELVFDQGLGDLFVIRVAGNVVAPSLLASLEFAAANFGSCLVMVMGHTKCGAIKAAVDLTLKQQKAPSQNLEDLILRIRPAVQEGLSLKRPASADSSQLIHDCTWGNVRHSISQIQEQSEIVRNLVASNKLMIVGSVFDLDTGVVQIDDAVLAQ